MRGILFTVLAWLALGLTALAQHARFVSGVTDQVIYFVAVDSADFTTREPDLASFTVSRSRNGSAPTLYTTPTITYMGANMLGVYTMLLDEDMTIDAGDDSQQACLHITHAGMAPVSLPYELYRPKITAGETLTVGSSVVPWNAAWDAEVESEVDDALGGGAGTALTAIPWNATWDAEIQSEADDALIAKALDHLVFTSVTGTDVADNSIMARLASKAATADWDTANNTTDSLEAIADATGGSMAARGDVVAVADSVITLETNPPVSGAAFYAVLFNKAGFAWNGTAFATYSTTRDTFDIPMPEMLGSVGVYKVSVPSLVPAGFLRASVYKRTGATPSHADDAIYGSDFGHWNGLMLVDSPEISTTVASVVSQTEFTFAGGPQLIGSLEDYSVRISQIVDSDPDLFYSNVRRVTSHSFDDPVHTITIDAVADFTVAIGDALEFVQPTISGETPTDINQEPIPTENTFTLVRTGNLGLLDRNAKSFAIGTVTSIAVDFRNAMPANGRVQTVNSVALSSGTAGGITFGAYGRDRTQARFPITPVTSGTYGVRVNITDTRGRTEQGVITIVVP